MAVQALGGLKFPSIFLSASCRHQTHSGIVIEEENKPLKLNIREDIDPCLEETDIEPCVKKTDLLVLDHQKDFWVSGQKVKPDEFEELSEEKWLIPRAINKHEQPENSEISNFVYTDRSYKTIMDYGRVFDC
ncbi:unnamed protein product [Ambrosiozyma monospora]|uniref:Unnamed protein product n=1 Tax=Ambrosiozyma monospora TaxID=43982 RepID=A0A9W6WHZ0_AMBMO|nr:unnamed protein product [Ambrosiozyma monospora]